MNDNAASKGGMLANEIVYDLILLSGSIFLILEAHYHWLVLPEGAHHLLREAGFAGVVATILIFTIERRSKARLRNETRELVEKMNADLFSAILRRKLPANVVSEIERCIFGSKVVRKKLNLFYQLKRVPNSSGGNTLAEEVVECDYRAVYILENVTDQDVKHALRVFVDFPISAAVDPRCELSSVKINPDPDGNADAGREVLPGAQPKTALDAQCMHVSHTEPLELKKGASVKVQIKARLVKNLYDTEIWCSMIPSDGCRIDVSVPHGDLLVTADAYNSKNLDPQHAQDSTTSFIWMLEHGMFPHQSVVLRWQPCNARTAGYASRVLTSAASTPAAPAASAPAQSTPAR